MSVSVFALALTIVQAPTAVAEAQATLDLSLEQAVEIGTSRSFRLQRSRRNDQIAKERLNGTKARLGPRADLVFGADQSQRYYDFDGTYDYNQGRPQFYTALGATASYDLDISGVRRRDLRQVELGKESSEVDVTQSTIDVASDIRSNYVHALRAQQQVEVDGEYLGLLDALIAKARSAQPSAVGFLDSERSNAALALEHSRQTADLSLSMLRELLRLGTQQPVKLTSLLSLPSQLPSRQRLVDIAYRNRGDLKQSDIRLKQARIARVQATDSRRPSLRASAFLSQAFNGDTFTLSGDDHGRTRSAGALLSFSMPIMSYDGGDLASTRNIANLQAEQAVADAEEAKERAENEIGQALIGIERAEERLKQLPDVEQARRSLAEAEAQMLSASASEAAGLIAQVSNARQNWRSSVLSRNDALTAYYGSYYRLQRSLGTEEIR